MGAVDSKAKTDKEVRNSVSCVPSTPPQCLKFENASHLDPRSPSDNVVRTPLEFSTINEAENDTNVILAIDPRSPTDQFTRTPIVIQGSSKLHNKLLDNVRKNIIHTPTSTKFQNSLNHSRRSVTPPKLLGSTALVRKTSNRKSLVGLLETNIDYRETNLDNFVKANSLDTNLTIKICDNDLPSGNIVECENCDPRSPSADFLRTPIQITKKVGEIDLNSTNNGSVSEQNIDMNCSKVESLLKIAEDSAGIIEEEDMNEQLDSIECVLKNSDICPDIANLTELKAKVLKMQHINPDTTMNDSLVHQHVVDIVQDLLMKVEAIIQPADIENNELHCKSLELHEEIIDLTADVQEFDRKLTKIILDNNETFSLKADSKIELKEVQMRTPMKDRNAITEPKKQKLRVSDKPRKSEYAVSKIPVFRDKNGSKLKIQCENTPPRNMEMKKKMSKAKWDTDRTLVI